MTHAAPQVAVMIDSNHNDSSLLDYTDVHQVSVKNFGGIAASDAGDSFHLRPDNESSIDNDGKKANLLLASAPALQQNHSNELTQ